MPASYLRENSCYHRVFELLALSRAWILQVSSHNPDDRNCCMNCQRRTAVYLFIFAAQLEKVLSLLDNSSVALPPLQAVTGLDSLLMQNPKSETESKGEISHHLCSFAKWKTGFLGLFLQLLKHAEAVF